MFAEIGPEADGQDGGQGTDQDGPRGLHEGGDPPREGGREPEPELEPGVGHRQEGQCHPVPPEQPDHEPVHLLVVEGRRVAVVDVTQQALDHRGLARPFHRLAVSPAPAAIRTAAPASHPRGHSGPDPASPSQRRQSSGR